MKRYLVLFVTVVMIGAGCAQVPEETIVNNQEPVELTEMEKIRMIFANREGIAEFISGTYEEMELCANGSCATYKADIENGKLVKVYFANGGSTEEIEFNGWEIKTYDARAYLIAFDYWYALQ